MSEHLQDPLEYLYEELPPDGMAAARSHLAECAECREAMRTVRETVKTYREADKPAAPAGLAARAARAALAAAKTDAAPVYPSLDEVTRRLEETLRLQQQKISQESLDAEYNRIREDVLGELKQRNWRSWLFHPAWTVAASVIFICALLIHISPRMNRTEVVYLPAAPNRDGLASQQIRDRERLPAAAPKHRDMASRAAPPEAAPPLLREAEALGAQPELPAAAPVAAAPAMAPAQMEAEPAIIDMLQDMEPPQLIARPTPINVPERIQTLTTLAGMQMANGEFEDAWKSVHLLERYDRDAARTLAQTLIEMQQAAPRRDEEPEPEPEDEPASEPVAEPQVFRPLTPPAPEPDPTPEPAHEVVELAEPTPSWVASPPPEPEPEAPELENPELEEPVVEAPPPVIILHPVTQSRAPAPRRRPFSTDPYIRGY